MIRVEEPTSAAPGDAELLGRFARERDKVAFAAIVGRYGPMVLAGLPKAARVFAPWAQVRLQCEDFFARHGIGASV